MGTAKLAAIVLIVLGVLALAYGGFTYTRESHDVSVGPLDLTVKDKETVNLPIWAGAGAIGIGALLLLTAKKN